tara:strand:- start:3066 stop:3479 length:414 start_codon:yes stop_codon:yes gene_type:complete
MIIKIGELAKISDCSVQSIRHYEKEQLLSAKIRSDGNFRLYDQADIERLLFIKHCRSLDLSLAEIRQLLTLHHSPMSQCEDVNQMIEQHIEQVERRIAELTLLNKQLKALRRSCTSKRTVEHCGILKQLNKAVSQSN